LRNTQFFSRSSQLDKLEQLLFLEERKPKIAITGLGGIGKIQIALELAYRTREKYRERSIFWILATSAESLHQAYLEVAQQLQIPGVEEEQADMKKLLQRHLSQEGADQCGY
jgi:anion-transporting  ArsA/GET3 family ATPase